MSPTEITQDIARSLLPERPPDGHKGTFGHLYAIAGSRGFTGAAKMVGEGACRSGVGLVTLGVPEPLGDVVASDLLETMTMLLPATPDESIAASAIAPALDFAEDKEAVALGPGLSQHPETQQFVLEFIQKCTVPLVVDADGLNALSENISVLGAALADRVLTPHPGEMARLCGTTSAKVQQAREGSARDFAESHGCTVVLKGHRTVVAGADGRVFVNTNGNSGMATGGTGDILTGLLGGLMAQGMEGMDAALLAVYVHGLAGDLAAEAWTERGMVASDLIGEIPEAWRILEEAEDA
ncbi:MAG: NAD(P)H-hydrate dehydratase [Candidatus Hydrogenedentes bacterium]|nr:NAD(P)H-hydrate dehydratase [Candidatus Hydrogenedentota bacterium]